MKKLLKGILSATLISSILLTTGCGSTPEEQTDNAQSNDATTTIVIGATVVPHAEILNFVKDDLAKEGINLEIKEFTDYTLLNPSTEDGSLDANFFQHTPFLDAFNETAKTKLVSVGAIHIEPLGAYSNAITSFDELKDGDKVGIPNDPTNEKRALLLLNDAGLIEVDETLTDITPFDITNNPLNLEFVELDGAQLPRTIDEFAFSVINTNYALEAGFNPSTDAITIEDGTNSPYANILVVPEGHENDEAILKLYEALTTDAVREFILSTYEGAVIPAF